MKKLQRGNPLPIKRKYSEEVHDDSAEYLFRGTKQLTRPRSTDKWGLPYTASSSHLPEETDSSVSEGRNKLFGDFNFYFQENENINSPLDFLATISTPKRLLPFGRGQATQEAKYSLFSLPAWTSIKEISDASLKDRLAHNT